MAKYTISKDHEDKHLATIAKTGHTVEFTLQSMKDNADYYTKVKTELEATLALKKAEMANLEHYHKCIKRLSDKQIFACWMYWEAKSKIKPHEDKLVEVNEILEKHNAELEAIQEQLGIAIEEPEEGEENA